jgi:hypothetical protein
VKPLDVGVIQTGVIGGSCKFPHDYPAALPGLRKQDTEVIRIHTDIRLLSFYPLSSARHYGQPPPASVFEY